MNHRRPEFISGTHMLSPHAWFILACEVLKQVQHGVFVF